MADLGLSGVERLARRSDHLGTLAAMLRDLGGPTTILHELTQNADDAKTATTVRFTFDHESLTVWNDGVFTGCGQPREWDCPWIAEDRRPCDLHSFQRLAGRTKANDAETTGAFGVGFTSVYQVTDHPELITSGVHLRMDEQAAEESRIEVCPGGCARDHALEGTTFLLPWARERSRMREALQAAPFTDSDIEGMQHAVLEHLGDALLFLQRIEQIEIITPTTTRSLRREAEPSRIRIIDGDVEEEWLLLTRDFSDEAASLTEAAGGLINAGRHSTVQLALPIGADVRGRLYASLPTESPTGLSGHINASFYPRTDRKGVLFENDYASRWNRAAIQAASIAIAEALEQICELLGFVATWKLLGDLEQVGRGSADGTFDPSFGAFFEAAKTVARESAIMLTADGRTVQPGGCRLPRGVDEYGAALALADLNLDLVHETLHPLVHATTHSAYGVSLLSASDVVYALRAAGLEEPWHASDSPSGTTHVFELLRLLQRLLDRPHGPIDGLERIAVIPCHGELLAPAEQSIIVADADHRALFELLDPDLLLVDEDRLRELCPLLLEECQPLTVWRVAEILEGIDTSVLSTVANDLLDWFDDHRGELRSPELGQRVAALPMFPSASGDFLPLTQMSLPSQFQDPIGMSELVDMQLAEGHVDLLRLLGAEELDAVEYLVRYVSPRALAGELTADQLRGVLEMVTRERGHLDPALLENLPIVLCLDGVVRVPTDVHLPSSNLSRIAPETPAARVSDLAPSLRDTLVWLGVAEHPSLEVLSSAAARMGQAATDVSPTFVVAMLEELRRVQAAVDVFPDALAAVADEAWMPVEGGGRSRPSQVYATFNRHLFDSQPPKLALPLGQQREFAQVLQWLDMPGQPSTTMVIAHLRECARSGAKMSDDVYRALGEAEEQHLVRALEDAECVQVAEGQFVQPATTYWSNSGMGVWTHHLPSEMRKYQDFFDRVGVRESPGPVEIETVLGNIAKSMGNDLLDEDALAVVHRCWDLLSSLLTEAPDETRRVLARVGRTHSVADTRGVLVSPESLVFRDARGLCTRFELLAHSIIPRDNATWRALSAAGVQSADDLIGIEVSDLASVPDPALQAHIRNLHEAFRRLIAGLLRDDEQEVDQGVLLDLSLESAPSLAVRYVLDIWNRRELTEALDVDAVYLSGDHRIVYKQADPPPYRGIARELARCLLPHGDPVRVAASLESLLRAASLEDGQEMLDDWGTPALEFGDFDVLESRAVVEVLTDDVADGLSDDGAGDWGNDRDDAAGDDNDSDLRAEVDLDDSFETEEEDWRTLAGASGKEAAGDAAPATSLDTDGSQDQGGSVSGSLGASPRSNASRPQGRTSAAQSKLRSYIVHGDEGDVGAHGDEAPDHSPIDEAGIRRVLAYEEACGRSPKEQEHANPGFDILSSDAQGNPLRRIEVKSTGGAWSITGVMLSRRQHEEARTNGADFWLYVVEHALDDNAFRIYRIHNLAAKIAFFGVDDGWKSTTESDGE